MASPGHRVLLSNLVTRKPTCDLQIKAVLFLAPLYYGKGKFKGAKIKHYWYVKIRVWFNMKMSSYQYRKSHCGDKTIFRPSYPHNGILYTGKMASLYCIGAQSSIKYAYVRCIMRIALYIYIYLDDQNQWQNVFSCVHWWPVDFPYK